MSRSCLLNLYQNVRAGLSMPVVGLIMILLVVFSGTDCRSSQSPLLSFIIVFVARLTVVLFVVFLFLLQIVATKPFVLFFHSVFDQMYFTCIFHRWVRGLHIEVWSQDCSKSDGCFFPIFNLLTMKELWRLQHFFSVNNGNLGAIARMSNGNKICIVYKGVKVAPKQGFQTYVWVTTVLRSTLDMRTEHIVVIGTASELRAMLRASKTSLSSLPNTYQTHTLLPLLSHSVNFQWIL